MYNTMAKNNCRENRVRRVTSDTFSVLHIWLTISIGQVESKRAAKRLDDKRTIMQPKRLDRCSKFIPSLHSEFSMGPFM
jgi:hypothetical protein